MMRIAITSGLALFALACTPQDDTAGSDEFEVRASSKAKATIIDQTGTNIGELKLSEDHGVVEGKVEIYVAPAGYHGLHIHGVGQCTATFTSAGGHFNPTGATHGNHAGDLPVLLVKADGTASARFETDRFTIAQILDADGAAVILHAAADNYANVSTRYFSTTENVSGADSATLATGDAGSRLGCGVIKASRD